MNGKTGSIGAVLEQGTDGDFEPEKVVKDAPQAEAPAVAGDLADRKAADPASLPSVRKNQEARPTLATNPSGTFALGTLSEQLGFAQRLIAEKMISETFKTPQQVVIGLQWALAMKMDPISALRFMYVVRGRPCLWGDGPLILVQRSGDLESIEEFYLDIEGKRICVENENLKAETFAAVTRVWKRGDPRPQEDFFTIDDMEQAGLGGKSDPWKKWTRIMLRYRARAMALKSKFGNLVNGIPIAEWDEEFTPELPGQSHQARKSLKAELNDELKDVQ